MEHLSVHLADFHKIWFLTIFGKSVEKIQVAMKSDWSSGYFTWVPTDIYYNISLVPPYNEKCFRQKLQRKSKHTFYFQWLLFVNHAVYEIVWKNMAEPDRLQKKIQCGVGALHAGQLRLQTHSGFVIGIYFPWKHWLRERVWMLYYIYTYIDCLQFIRPNLCALKCEHSSSPTCFGTSWVPSSGSPYIS
jgi:hypothetical protein